MMQKLNKLIVVFIVILIINIPLVRASWFSDAWNAVTDTVSNIVDAVVDVVDNTFDVIGDIVEGAIDIVGDITTGIGDIVNSDTLVDLGHSINQGAELTNAIIDLAGDVISETVELVAYVPITTIQATVDWIQGENFGDAFTQNWRDNVIEKLGIYDYLDWQPASYTIRESKTRGCGNDYCGDCEDHSILRAALLRSLGVNPYCIFDARGSDGDKTHRYNIVLYKEAYRIMDYYELGTYFNFRWSMHQTTDISNDKIPWSLPEKYTFNYPNKEIMCPEGGWTPETYYKDVCP